MPASPRRASWAGSKRDGAGGSAAAARRAEGDRQLRAATAAPRRRDDRAARCSSRRRSRARSSPTDTVFIFARAVEGPRMPLAILQEAGEGSARRLHARRLDGDGAEFRAVEFPVGHRRRARVEVGQRDAAERRSRRPVVRGQDRRDAVSPSSSTARCPDARRARTPPMSTPGSTDVDVAVVGAGVSGLATAFELQRRGLAVEVLEAAAARGRRDRHAPSRRRARTRPGRTARSTPRRSSTSSSMRSASATSASRRARSPRRATSCATAGWFRCRRRPARSS